jgi:hypothetical protein
MVDYVQLEIAAASIYLMADAGLALYYNLRKTDPEKMKVIGLNTGMLRHSSRHLFIKP